MVLIRYYAMMGRLFVLELALCSGLLPALISTIWFTGFKHVAICLPAVTGLLLRLLLYRLDGGANSALRKLAIVRRPPSPALQ